MSWTDTEHCQLKVHCGTCRRSDEVGMSWRADMLAQFGGTTNVNFDCPHGVAWDRPDHRIVLTNLRIKPVDRRLLKLDVEGLTALAATEYGEQGRKHAQEALDRAADPACTDCGRRKAEAALRVWITEQRTIGEDHVKASH